MNFMSVANDTTRGSGEDIGPTLQSHYPGEKTMVRNFQSDDKGKHVRTDDGHVVGEIEETAGSTAHVMPEEELPRSTRRRLGWSEEQEEKPYEISTAQVEQITDDEIHLREDL